MTYRLVVPPGWAAIPTAVGAERETAAAVEAVVQRALPADLPRDRAEPYRGELRGRLQRVCDEARRGGAETVVLPSSGPGGEALPGSFTVSRVVDAERSDPRELLAALRSGSDDEIAPVEVDGAPGVRTQGLVAPDPVMDPLAVRPGVRVTYLLPVPAEPATWLLLVFTALEAGDRDLQAALVGVFDALVQALRWTGQVSAAG